jgi:hypothetical protein
MRWVGAAIAAKNSRGIITAEKLVIPRLRFTRLGIVYSNANNSTHSIIENTFVGKLGSARRIGGSHAK